MVVSAVIHALTFGLPFKPGTILYKVNISRGTFDIFQIGIICDLVFLLSIAELFGDNDLFDVTVCVHHDIGRFPFVDTVLCPFTRFGSKGFHSAFCFSQNLLFLLIQGRYTGH